MKILITGGAGYIGSHVALQLIKDPQFSNDQFVILDSLVMGHLEFVKVLQAEAKKLSLPEVLFEQVDLLDPQGLSEVFEKHRPRAVLHFAARISVAESVQNPELYFKNNAEGSLNLLHAMQKSGCKKIVFSSTAAVYGKVDQVEPLAENLPLLPINPYAESKVQIENALREAAKQWELQSVIFRYFNACGASLTGVLGEWHEPETHLIPLILESVIAQKKLSVFGNDYPTRDGTCIRDYIHVEDLAEAHRLGLNRLLGFEVEKISSEVFNLGTTSGTSVLEVISAAEKVCEKKVFIEFYPRRAGDAAVLVASNALAKKVLGWEPKYSDMETIIKTAYEWLKSRSHR